MNVFISALLRFARDNRNEKLKLGGEMDLSRHLCINIVAFFLCCINIFIYNTYNIVLFRYIFIEECIPKHIYLCLYT